VPSALEVAQNFFRHSVWKNTSERVARRCDDTVDKKRVNSGVLKTPLFGESWATKNITKKPRKCSLRRATNVMFSKFRGWCRQKKPRAAQFFVTVLRAVLINELIRGQRFWQVVFFTEHLLPVRFLPSHLFLLHIHRHVLKIVGDIGGDVARGTAILVVHKHAVHQAQRLCNVTH